MFYKIKRKFFIKNFFFNFKIKLIFYKFSLFYYIKNILIAIINNIYNFLSLINII